ncbi:hypothetical protein J132_05854 [Termitomyces sp. J132]|nr:hypothetical protein J132_05854 [Termitomyces sp. J132]
MSAYNSAYNPTGYLTDVYGWPVPENQYALFYLGPPVNQYVLHYWTPDPNQAFYTPFISQGILPGWCHPPAVPSDGNYPCLYLRGFSTAPPNPAYLPPTHYYAYPVPAAVPAPSEHPDNYSPP